MIINFCNIINSHAQKLKTPVQLEEFVTIYDDTVPGKAMQLVKGSPVNPVKHAQTGRWFMHLHWALEPQTPNVHGFVHL